MPQARPRLRQIAHPASQRACGSAHRAWRRRVWRRDRPSHLLGRVRVRAERSSLANAIQAPGACRRGSVACAQECARTRRYAHRVVGRRRGIAAPRRRDRGTKQDVHRAHPGRDLPAGAGPRPAPHLACDAGVASRAGSLHSCANTPKPALGHRGAACRDTRPWDTSVGCCGQSWRNLPVSGNVATIPLCGSYRIAIKWSSNSGYALTAGVKTDSLQCIAEIV
ncbi:hypothetical protein CSC12_6024 (plasmid) [Klebsiella michiganensis]|nr:hypothetical protein CSC12_6024 [Klebsiella michiganensis]